MIQGLRSAAADPEVALPSTDTAGDQAFPTLTEAQIARVAAHGHLRKVERGEVLVKAGARNASFFVVVPDTWTLSGCPTASRRSSSYISPVRSRASSISFQAGEQCFPSVPAKQAK